MGLFSLTIFPKLLSAVDQAQLRTQSAVTSIKQGSYPPSQFLADVFAGWVDAADIASLWTRSISWTGNTTVLIKASAGDREATGVLRAPWIKDSALTKAYLVGDTGTTIDIGDIDATFFPDMQVLVVRVKSATGFARDSYGGTLSQAGTDVARVLLEVS